MNHCQQCNHLEQIHNSDGWCLVCSLIVNCDSEGNLTGYCGKDNLKYLEYLYDKKSKRKGEINV